jgi:hypothetical protein
MTLLERLLRTLLQNGGVLREVRVELPAGATRPAGLPAELVAALPLRWSNSAAPIAQRFRLALEDAQEPLLAISADTVLDARLLLHFQSATGSLAFVARGPEPGGALLRLENALPGIAEGDQIWRSRSARSRPARPGRSRTPSSTPTTQTCVARWIPTC